MTERHPSDERIQDFVDDALPAPERAETARHLEGCARCAAERDAYRSLRERLAALPVSVETAYDAWPDLRARLDVPETPEPKVVALPSRPVWRTWGAGLAAAAALAVAATLLLSDRGPQPEGTADAPTARVTTGPARTAPSTPAAEGVPGLETELRGLGREVMAAFAARHAALPPEITDPLLRDLAVVERAIDETRTALAEHPDSPGLRRLLRVRHEQKLALMGHLVRIARSA